MATNSWTLEIKVISAKNLQLDRKPIKKKASVTVRADTNSQFRTTDMDTKGGAYPRWNEKLVLDLPKHSKSITVEVQCKTLSSIRTIGTAIIPATDFVGGYVPEGYLHLLSYRLRDHNGERNGIINISVSMKAQKMYVYASSTGSHSTKGGSIKGPGWSQDHPKAWINDYEDLQGPPKFGQ
ncbi:hypothetical protein EV1_040265 [Malus domestica]